MLTINTCKDAQYFEHTAVAQITPGDNQTVHSSKMALSR